MSKKGFSLIEILVALGILGIMTGIATVSYQGYILDVTKRTLKDSGKLFQVAVNTCIKVNRGWKITRYTRGTEICPVGKTDPCIEITPCKATNTAELKKKLNFTCPAGATCAVFSRTEKDNPDWKYYCLDIRKEVSGKKLQVITRVSYDDPSNYQILCSDDMSQTNRGNYMNLDNSTCKKGKHQNLTDHGFTTQETTPADRSIIFCKWK